MSISKFFFCYCESNTVCFQIMKTIGISNPYFVLFAPSNNFKMRKRNRYIFPFAFFFSILIYVNQNYVFKYWRQSRTDSMVNSSSWSYVCFLKNRITCFQILKTARSSFSFFYAWWEKQPSFCLFIIFCVWK